MYNKFKDVFQEALVIRFVELKLLELFSQGKLTGTVHTCVGQEFIPVFLNKYSLESDFWLSNHRGHGHFIAKTKDLKGLLAEILSKDIGVSKGFGGSQHLYSEKFISNGIQGGLFPTALGIGFSYKKDFSESIVTIFLGDGTLGEGIIYESFNLCALWEIPVLFVLENNFYAQSTCSSQTFSGDLETRIKGFGIEYFKTNTNDLDSLDSTCKVAVDYVRNRRLPGFLEIETFRLLAHSKGDDNRKSSVIDYQNQNDILNQVLNSSFLNIDQIKLDIDSLVESVLLSPNSSYVSKFEFVLDNKVNFTNFTIIEGRLNNNIYKGLSSLFEKDNNVFFIGEDIEFVNDFTEKPYGGAFKVSQDLSLKHPDRVRNTPISEAAIIGLGIGLSLNNCKSIVEIMFGDFITLGFDQILQHASKISSMYGRKINIPVVIRTPMGGRRGYGPTHSQSLEKHFFGIPNINIVAINSRINVEILYSKLFENINNLTILIENKVGYTRFQNENILLGYDYFISDEIFPTLSILPQDSDLPFITIACYGQMVEEVERAAEILFEKYEISVDIICFSSIQPLNINPLINSINRTKRVLVVEEGCGIAGFNSIIASYLLSHKINVLDFSYLSFDDLISADSYIEGIQLINSQSIFMEISKLLNYEK